MQRLFYSTGQVACQLGITPATVRLLCETRAIASETTPGGQLRVPASEVERLKRDGLPTIPRPLPTERPTSRDDGPAGHHSSSEFVAQPSVAVVAAADQVVITKSTLERRKIEREIEENEDWFRDRQRREAEAEAAERQRTETEQAEQRRLRWVQDWTQRALDSLPNGARLEVELEVHAAVQKALSGLQPNQPDAITRRLVEAVVHKALWPWTKKQDIERALKAAMNRLPWEVRYRAEYATLKQRSWEAAVAAVGKVRDGACQRL